MSARTARSHAWFTIISADLGCIRSGLSKKKNHKKYQNLINVVQCV
jgi:hypothetical protein